MRAGSAPAASVPGIVASLCCKAPQNKATPNSRLSYPSGEDSRSFDLLGFRCWFTEPFSCDGSDYTRLQFSLSFNDATTAPVRHHTMPVEGGIHTVSSWPRRAMTTSSIFIQVTNPGRDRSQSPPNQTLGQLSPPAAPFPAGSAFMPMPIASRDSLMKRASIAASEGYNMQGLATRTFDHPQDPILAWGQANASNNQG